MIYNIGPSGVAFAMATLLEDIDVAFKLKALGILFEALEERTSGADARAIREAFEKRTGRKLEITL